jgi:hypothetical protein
MKNMSDYPNTNPATMDAPSGTFKNESQPNANDGTDIKAEHMQDVYYALYQILQLAGEIPNGELENGNLSKQFIRCLTNIGWLKYDSNITYKRNSIVINTVNNITKIYRSQKDDNTDPLPDINENNNKSWINILTIGEDNVITLNTASSDNTGAFIGSFMYGLRRDTPEGWLRCDGNKYPASVFQNFINQYITTEKIPSIAPAQYEEELANNNDNCGCFGYDETNSMLRVPKFKDNVFIAQALNAGNIAKYNKDQNKSHSHSYRMGGTWDNVNNQTTAMLAYSNENLQQTSDKSGYIRNEGEDKAQPRHIQYPLFICLSNSPVPASEAQYNEFVNGLNMLTQSIGLLKVGEYVIGNGAAELIIPLNNNKTYKIILEDMRSSSDSNNPFLCLRFGNGSSFANTGYNTNSERLFTGSYGWDRAYHNNYNCILLNYPDGYVYNSRALSGELNIPASRATTFPVLYGTTNSVRPSDNCLTTSKFNGELNVVDYDYTRIRLFPSANSFVSGIVKVYQMN